VLLDVPLDLAELLIVEADQVDIELDALLGAGIGEAFGDVLPIESLAEVLADLGKVVLTVGVLDRGQPFRTFAHQRHAPAHQVSSPPQCSGKT
jgi:uncharacterized protein YbjT (DUF2867 family)